MRNAWMGALFLALVSGCGERSDGTGDEQKGVIDMGTQSESIDTSEAGLVAFVKEKRYAEWTAEPAAHDTAGPHGDKVRTYFNATVAASLRDGKPLHPKGSVLVKELIGSDGKLTGHALDVKVEDGSGETKWLFFEGFVADDYANNFYGVAHPTCHGCHAGGTDYVLSALP